MTAPDAVLAAATNYELCIWLWVNAVDCLHVTTEDDCWMVRVATARGADYIRVPTTDDRMPDFNHPHWPAARKALMKLKGA